MKEVRTSFLAGLSGSSRTKGDATYETAKRDVVEWLETHKGKNVRHKKGVPPQVFVKYEPRYVRHPMLGNTEFINLDDKTPEEVTDLIISAIKADEYKDELSRLAQERNSQMTKARAALKKAA